MPPTVTDEPEEEPKLAPEIVNRLLEVGGVVGENDETVGAA